MKRHYRFTTLAFLAGTLATVTVGQSVSQQAAPGETSTPSSRDVTADWPIAPKNASAAYTQKYGHPDESSKGMVTWNDRGDFSKITIYRDSLTDPVPTPHQTFIEHQVRYTVPAFRVADLQNFDKSLVIDTKTGTLASRGDNEKSNILALNLADQIVTGKRTVADAQNLRAKTESLTMAGKTSDLTQGLKFKVDKAGKPHMVRAVQSFSN